MAAEPMPGSSPERRLTGHGGNPPGQGPFIDLTLIVGDGVVRQAAYETYQCPGCHACGKAVVALVAGKTLSEARTLRHEDIVKVVGPLPRYRQVCYSLALLALDDALKRVDQAKAVERQT